MNHILEDLRAKIATQQSKIHALQSLNSNATTENQQLKYRLDRLKEELEDYVASIESLQLKVRLDELQAKFEQIRKDKVIEEEIREAVTKAYQLHLPLKANVSSDKGVGQKGEGENANGSWQLKSKFSTRD
jgi:predicted RNase H-like nuclease (RuvC/YqgF family)